MAKVILPSDPDIDLYNLGGQVVQSLQLKTELANVATITMLENLRLLDRKQLAYGPGNLTKFGVLGVVIRANDKMERLITLTRNRLNNDADHSGDESIADTLRDLSNYGVIGYLMASNRWGNTP
jgi:hypothetical protein